MLRGFIKTILVEGKVQDLEKKYLGKIEFEAFKDLSQSDPSPTKKYLDWMCKQKIKGSSNSDIIATIQYFHKNMSRFEKKDINAYQDLKSLEDKVKEISLKQPSSIERKGNVKKLFEDDKFVVLRPDNKQAVISYGANTKWCITMFDSTYYEQYVQSNVVFYFFIDKIAEKDDQMAKVALAIQRDQNNNSLSNELYDAMDNRISEQDLFDNFGSSSTYDEYGDTEGSEFSELIEKLYNDAINDSKTVPKAFLARLKADERVSNEEVINYWNVTFTKEQKEMGYERTDDVQGYDYDVIAQKKAIIELLTIAQQREVAKIDKFVSDIIDDGEFFINDRGRLKIVSIDSTTTRKFLRDSDNQVFVMIKQTENYLGGHTKTENFDSGEIVELYVHGHKEFRDSKDRIYFEFSGSNVVYRTSDEKEFYVVSINFNDHDLIKIDLISKTDSERVSASVNKAKDSSSKVIDSAGNVYENV